MITATGSFTTPWGCLRGGNLKYRDVTVVLRILCAWASLVCVIFAVGACGSRSAGNAYRTETVGPSPPPAAEPGTAEGPKSTSPQTSSTGVNGGPYLGLISLSAQQVEQQLGRPNKVTHAVSDSLDYWDYPDLGLRVAMWKGSRVFWISQTEGRITENLRIGDSEEQVEKLIGTPSTTLNGDKVVRVDTERFSYELHLRQGRIISAQILPPGTDT